MNKDMPVIDQQFAAMAPHCGLSIPIKSEVDVGS
jgi:hypothetical protein